MVKSCFRFVVLLSLLFVASCTSYKRVPYLQNSEEYGKNAKEALLYEPTIKPNDVLNIVVLNTEEPSTSALYNLIVPTDMSRSSTLVSQPMLRFCKARWFDKIRSGVACARQGKGRFYEDSCRYGAFCELQDIHSRRSDLSRYIYNKHR